MTLSPPSPDRPRVAILQDGARLHYALPVALHRAGILEAMFTEWFLRSRSPRTLLPRLLALAKPDLARRMADRRNPDLDSARIVTNLPLLLRLQAARRRFPTPEAYFAWCSDQVARWVLRRGFGRANALLGYVRNISPDLCRAARDRGLTVVADQIIAPSLVEETEARLQHERFPGWQKLSTSAGAPIVQSVESATWESLSHITCASDYVRSALVGLGQDPRRISVLPYPIDASHFAAPDRRHRPGPLTVGFVGAVGLRKGAPYFFQVARRFDPARVRFVMVGPVGLEASIAASERGPVELVGSVPRSDIPSWLDRFDLYLFPSTCEGSAGSVMEALASGLPVITSPNSGSVVRDAQEGFLCPYDAVDLMADRITRLAAEPDLRHAMSLAARRRAEEFNLDWYSQSLLSLFQNIQAPHP